MTNAQRYRLNMAVALIAMAVLFISSVSFGQATLVGDAVEQGVKLIFERAGSKELQELTELGGKAAVREVLQKAGVDGGIQLVERLDALVLADGPSVLRAAAENPEVMVGALEKVSPEMRPAVLRAVEREPEVLTRLTETYGKDALETAAMHPGVGTEIVDELGANGIEASRELATDQAIVLGRNAEDIAQLPPPAQAQFWGAFQKTPAKTIEFLEAHPQVLKQGARVVIAGEVITGGVVGLDLLRREIFGQPDDQGRGLPERMLHDTLTMFRKPLSAVLVVVALALCAWVSIHLWKTVELARRQVRLSRDSASHKSNV